MSQSIPTDEQLASYLADALPATERARVDAWADADPAHRAELERLRAAWLPRTASARWNVDRAWTHVDAQLDRGATVIALPGAPLERSTSWHRQTIWRVAAGVLLVVGAGSVWRARSSSTAHNAQRFTTDIGEPRDLVLADSTRVALGPSSTLRVLAGYGGRVRVVELVGEAWFQVRHDANRPFSVRAAGTITSDLGTEFAVRAVQGDTVVRVTVYDGVASLRRDGTAANRAVTLRAHDVGLLTANSATVRTGQDDRTRLAWRDGQLSFETSTLLEVVAELRRWYRVTIVPPDGALGARRVSATLPSGDLAEALDILRLALGIEIVQRGDTVSFR